MLCLKNSAAPSTAPYKLTETIPPTSGHGHSGLLFSQHPLSTGPRSSRAFPVGKAITGRAAWDGQTPPDPVDPYLSTSCISPRKPHPAFCSISFFICCMQRLRTHEPPRPATKCLSQANGCLPQITLQVAQAWATLPAPGRPAPPSAQKIL